MRALRALRSFAAIAAALFFLGFAAPVVLYLVVIPARLLRPERARDYGVLWVSRIAQLLVALLRAGGASFEFEGEIDGGKPGVIIMNHQSILDIPPLIHIVKGRLPRFVVRARYTRWIPTVSAAIRFIDCITVDPKRDRAAAVLALHTAAKAGVSAATLIYPEGHRSKTGEILPFRPAGLTALLQPRPLPVWTVVHDGMWRLRKLTDTVFALSTVKCRMRVVDCVMSPEDPADLPAFIEERRQNLISALARLRAETGS